MNCKAIPDYAKSFKKEYIFLLGIDEGLSYVHKYIVLNDIENGIFGRKSKWMERLYNQIKNIKKV